MRLPFAWISLPLAACALAAAALSAGAPPAQPAHAEPAASPAQAPMQASEPPAAEDAASNPADVQSIDSILAALYAVISGPAGVQRDWDRFHALFVPAGARLVPTGPPRPDGAPSISFLSPAQYAERAAGMFERQGFFESEAHREVQSFGRIAHAFSTYESRYAAGDPEPFQRGINSIQLMHDAGRWWIVSIYWDSEREDNPIPPRYAPRD